MIVVTRIWGTATGRLGLMLSGLMVVMAVLAPLLAPYAPAKIDVVARLAAPSALHWLGTDQLGRDLFSRVLYGARIAVGVGLAVVLLALAVGVLLGVVAVYAPRAVDRAIMACFDIISSFPSLILALALVAVLGPGLTNVIALVTVVFIPHYGRVARAQTLMLKSRAFLEAEQVLGSKSRADRLVSRAAQHHRADHRACQHGHPGGDHAGGRIELPRRRHPAAAGELGQHAFRRLHLSEPVGLAGDRVGAGVDPGDARFHVAG